MKLLLVVPAYPYPAHPYSGVFNQRCALALSEICDRVEVLAPRPYAPSPLARLHARWKAYSQIPGHQREGPISVHRPAYPQIPGSASILLLEHLTYLGCRIIAARRHAFVGFDAILSFDLLGAGPLAWRLARRLGIPAAGWATGDDVRVMPDSARGRSVDRALHRLNLVFYQSRELLQKAASLMGVDAEQMAEDRHIVLPRGIAAPPAASRAELRRTVREGWGFNDEHRVVVSIGRISREKGIFELIEAATRVCERDGRFRFLAIGAHPGFDEAGAALREIERRDVLRERFRILPACQPHEVWQYLYAADVFAFASHNEGMPNSLLEAMAAGAPSVAFAIPPVREIDDQRRAIAWAEPFDCDALAREIVRFGISEVDRERAIGAGHAIVQRRFMVRTNMRIAVQKISELSGGLEALTKPPQDRHGERSALP